MNGKRVVRRAAVSGVAVAATAVFMLLAFRYREAGRSVAARVASAVRRDRGGDTGA